MRLFMTGFPLSCFSIRHCLSRFSAKSLSPRLPDPAAAEQRELGNQTTSRLGGHWPKALRCTDLEASGSGKTQAQGTQPRHRTADPSRDAQLAFHTQGTQPQQSWVFPSLRSMAVTIEQTSSEGGFIRSNNRDPCLLHIDSFFVQYASPSIQTMRLLVHNAKNICGSAGKSRPVEGSAGRSCLS